MWKALHVASARAFHLCAVSASSKWHFCAECAGPSSASASTSQAAASTTITTAWQGINEAEPSTSIQIRLADGTRMVAKFNLTQTVADIRRFIKASRPDMQEGYGLQMNGFPPKQLSNNEESIKDAGLEGAVVIQKQ